MLRAVVKAGGSKGVSRDAVADLVAQVARLDEIVLVHGASGETNLLAERLGKPPRFVTSVSGLESRYTDRETLEIFEMAYCGKGNKALVEAFQSRGINAVGLSGLDGRIFEGKRKDTITILDGGKRKVLRGDYTGKVERVNLGLTRKVLVRPDGRISFPLVQDLQAAGVTPGDLKEQIQGRLKQYLTAPSVTVIVDGIRSYTVFVVGKVQKPGGITNEKPITVLQAVAMAGGFQDYAKDSEMTVVRSSGKDHLVFEFNYKDVVRGKRPEQNIYLKSGDVVVVP